VIDAEKLVVTQEDEDVENSVVEDAVTTCNTFDCAACVPLPLGNVIPAVPSMITVI
jgi:hypothetical protein